MFSGSRTGKPIGEMDSQIRFLEHVEQANYRPASEQFRLQATKICRFWLWFEWRERDPSSILWQELHLRVVGQVPVELLQGCCHFLLKALNKSLDVLWLMEGLVVGTAF